MDEGLRLMRFRQMFLLNVLGFIVIFGLLIAGYIYFSNRSKYVSTNDASVSVQSTSVVALASGKLTSWALHDGDTVSKGQVIGIETTPTGQTMNLTSPINGDVLKQDAVAGEIVVPGDLLAELANLSNEYIVAYVPETDIRHVVVGQTVDIYLDAYPGTTFSGVVQNIGALSASYSSLIPSSQSAGNFTKEVQRIAVRISLSGNEGKLILPGMNASVRIHRNNP